MQPQLVNSHEPTVARKHFTWWQAALFVIAINGVNALLNSNRSSRKRKIKQDYNKQKQAPWAPPAAVFFPVWLFNNVVQAAGNVRLLNQPDFPNRRLLLILQALMWLDYVTFGKVAVGLKRPSNILSLTWTEAFTLMSLGSLVLAWKGGDRKILWSQVPLSLWGLYASTLGWYQVANNPDELFQTQPLLAKESGSNNETPAVAGR